MQYFPIHKRYCGSKKEKDLHDCLKTELGKTLGFKTLISKKKFSSPQNLNAPKKFVLNASRHKH